MPLSTSRKTKNFGRASSVLVYKISNAVQTNVDRVQTRREQEERYLEVRHVLPRAQIKNTYCSGLNPIST